MSTIIQPEGWPRPRGYSNGVTAEGRILAVAGQIGWNANCEFESDDFLAQAKLALENVIAIVRAAGASPRDIVRMTVYVTDKHEYRAAAPAFGIAYKALLEGHYPTMSLIQVAALLEDRAKIEIEATAVF